MTNLELIDRYLKNALNVAFVERDGDDTRAKLLVLVRVNSLSHDNKLPFVEQPGTTPQAE